jgi:hypothetical protein
LQAAVVLSESKLGGCCPLLIALSIEPPPAKGKQRHKLIRSNFQRK